MNGWIPSEDIALLTFFFPTHLFNPKTQILFHLSLPMYYVYSYQLF